MSVRSDPDVVDAAILDACDRIRALLARALRDEVLSRFEVGALLLTVKRAPSTYGEHAIERLAAELGMTTATLYRYATVAANWSLAEIHAQSARTSRFGEPLSWSHLVALTRATDPRERRALVDESLAKGWSVRKLTQVIASRHERVAESDEGGLAEASVRVALTEGIQSAARATVELDIFAEALASRLAELDDDTGADEALVTRAIDTFHELHARAESTLTQLRGASRASEKRLRCAPPVQASERAQADTIVDEDEERASGAPPTRARVPRR